MVTRNNEEFKLDALRLGKFVELHIGDPRRVCLASRRTGDYMVTIRVMLYCLRAAVVGRNGTNQDRKRVESQLALKRAPAVKSSALAKTDHHGQAARRCNGGINLERDQHVTARLPGSSPINTQRRAARA